MGQKFAAFATAVASPAAIWDAFEFNTSSTKSTIIHSMYIGQTSDMGDAVAEGLTVQLITGHATSGSGGSTVTPNPTGGGGTAGGAFETNNTTIASTGTPLTRHADVWNEQLPYQYRPTPEERIELPISTRLVCRISAPADAITVTWTIIFEEIG